MPKRRALSEDEVRELKAAIKAARTPNDLRTLLCVWLPEALGLTGREVAKALVLSRAAVEEARWRCRRGAESGLKDGRRRSFEPGTAAALAAALKRVRSANELRRLQCVLLPVLFNLDSRQVAAAVGWTRPTVTEVQGRYRRGGVAALLPPEDLPDLTQAAALTLRAAMTHARTAPEYRRAQCLFLRIVLGYSSRQVARIVGWRVDTVTHLVTRYRREGDAALRRPGRGGRRWRLFTVKQEAAVLRQLAQQHYDYGYLMFPVIHQAFEKAAGCPLQASVVIDILVRHHWTVAAVITTPRGYRRPEHVER